MDVEPSWIKQYWNKETTHVEQYCEPYHFQLYEQSKHLNVTCTVN